MKFQKGQSLFEVVLALGVMTAIMVGIVSLAAGAIKNSIFSKNKTLAARYAQEATEWLRRERDTDFTLFAAHSPGTYCFENLNGWPAGTCGSSDNITGTILYREIILSGASTITAEVKVYWTDAQGVHEVRSVTYFTDWRQR